MEEARFATIEGRRQNREEIDRLVAAWLGQLTAAEAVSRLQESRIAAGIVQDAADLVKDPQLEARGFFVRRGAFIDASPIKMGRRGAKYKRPAPAPGQDNDYVYGRLLGLSKKEMVELKEKGVI